MREKIAIISPLPPEKTGVAEYSYLVWKDCPNVDLFWTDSNSSFSIDEIFQKTIAKNYRYIVFTLSNSNHAMPVVRALAKFSGFPGIFTKLALHIHDPVLSNVAEKYWLEKGINYLSKYSNIDKKDINDYGNNYEAFLKNKISGLTSLIENHNISKIICHSNAAADICNQDFHGRYHYKGDFLIQTLPVNQPKQVIPWHLRRYDAGIFGILENGNKMSDKVIAMLKKIRDSGIINNIVIAGYNANDYIKSENLNPEEFSIFSDIGQKTLEDIIANTKFALLPRRINTGETSGLIPIILASGAHPIVSNIGSFSELPDILASKFDNDVYFDKSKDFIVKNIENNYLQASHQSYQQENSLENYRDKILNSLLG